MRARECDIELILEGDTLDEDIENLILNSNEGIPESMITSYSRKKSGPKRIPRQKR